MEMNSLESNAFVLEQEMQWLAEVISTRFKLYFSQESAWEDISEIPMPTFEHSNSPYAQLIETHKMGLEERVILAIALAPHVRPQILDVFFTKNTSYDRGFTEFGGVKGTFHSGFLPTGETATFILAGNDLSNRFKLISIFDSNHFFNKKNILRLEHEKLQEPVLSGTLQISQEYLTRLTTGEEYQPDYSTEFPAQLLKTPLDWNDLVVESDVLDQVDEIMSWIKHGEALLQLPEIGKKVKRGYRSLFYGPPGTGKTLTATLMGKTTNMPVYRIDLSKIVSKYIGETEKNLSNIFNQAENRKWILFFDEADALFGKRTAGGDSKDRYANQEVSYLLQRIEDFPGIIILATNLKTNMDEAFARRFQSMIYFPAPGSDLRITLWKNAFKGDIQLKDENDLKVIARKYELTGGGIMNVCRYCALMALETGNNEITFDTLEEGIRREFKKEGKTT